MPPLTQNPILFAVVSFVAMWLTFLVGVWLRRRRPMTAKEASDDFGLVLSATLTLLGLIIGFTFAMSTGRYDLRKTYEEAEANAIGTEYSRADLLPAADAARTKALLVAYLDQRIAYYTTPDEQKRAQVNRRVDALQAQLWSAVQVPATAAPTPVNALAVAGMNDVLNSSGYTEAAMLNRIPRSAWTLLAAVALFSNLLLAFGLKSPEATGRLSFILPLLVTIAFLLIADIDTPWHGLIRVSPQISSSWPIR